MTLTPRVVFAVAMPVIAVLVMVIYGITPLSLLADFLLLLCPIGVIWQGLRMSKRTEREIDAAVSKQFIKPQEK